MATRGRAKRSREDDYKFLPLKDAVLCPQQRVNLLGVVTEVGLPWKTKGTDYVCTLKVVDESYQTPAVPVNIFALRPEALPKVRAVGDLVQLSLIKMRLFDGEAYALFDKMHSSFALYEGKASVNLRPYQVSSKFNRRDIVIAKDLIELLRAWQLNFRLNAGVKEYLLSLKEIKEEGKWFDLICKVLLVYKVSENEHVLFVWDGTDCSPLCIPNKLEDEEQNPLPLQLEPCLSRDNLCTFPCEGTVFRVVVKQEYHNCDLSLLRCGGWVKFRNIVSKVQSGMWYGAFSSTSRITLLSDEDNMVLLRLRDYEEGKSSHLQLSTFPNLSSVTDTDYGDVPCTTLMSLLRHSKVNAKFKCVVRVVAILPWRVEDFYSPVTHKHMLRLTLEDSTARIHAFVFDKDGEKFFQGHPSVEELTVKRDRLLGITANDSGVENNTTSRNPPWVECCIKSYYHRKDDPWGSRQYRVFGTTIKV
ncbi:hypothetical protein Syun_008197 [Stephania yunnanensis]|uniref:Protection of telomeres protein 1 n=1 Tax=Stephania yunnanensis TaxID=152371 RepID=A0AAP0L002_9MAGN